MYIYLDFFDFLDLFDPNWVPSRGHRPCAIRAVQGIAYNQKIFHSLLGTEWSWYQDD